MSKKIEYEILLSSNQELLEQAKSEIKKVFKKKITPVDYQEFSREGLQEYILKVKVPKSEIWETARKLIGINGVVDVDPELTTTEDPTYRKILILRDKLREENIESTERPELNWFHKNIRFKEALDYVNNEFKNNRGHFDPSKKYKIAQFDTGYTNHPEISNVNKNGYNYVAGWLRRIWDRKWRRDARDKLRNLRPIFWASHGTSTAAVIIGTDKENNRSDIERSDGLLPNNIDLIPFRVSQNIISFDNKLSEAAHQVVNLEDIKVITMSHASLFRKRRWKEAVNKAYEKGIIWVAAAGTHAPEVLQSIIVFPAKFKETIAVACSKFNDEPWERTHHGHEVDLCAPGFDIYIPSSRRRWYGLLPNKYNYKWSEGTSFSAPIVATAATLWLAHQGEEKLNNKYPEPWQRVEAFRKNLKESCRPHKKGVSKDLYGAGLLDVEKLVKMELPDKKDLVHALKETKNVIELKSEKEMDEYIAKKELTYLTARAKIQQIGSDKDELYDFVYRNSSAKLKSLLDKLISEEPVKDTSRSAQKNQKSEILKENVKKYIEEYD